MEDTGPMVEKQPRTEPYSKYHKDGSLWARGQILDRVPVGCWEWFRKDGTLLRSGTFENGAQVGAWTTFDQDGNVTKDGGRPSN